MHVMWVVVDGRGSLSVDICVSRSHYVSISGSVWVGVVGVGRCGSVWFGVGRCGSVWVGVGRCGSVYLLVKPINHSYLRNHSCLMLHSNVNFELCPRVMPSELRLFRFRLAGITRSHVICKYIRVTPQDATRIFIQRNNSFELL